MNTNYQAKKHTEKSIGTSVLRQENHALLLGRGTFVDDIPVKQGTAHAAILRSPHAHAIIKSIETHESKNQDGVFAVITGRDMVVHTDSMKTPVDTPMKHYGLAVDRVRFVGEPVAVVCAKNRYLAENAAEKIQVEYEVLKALVDPIESTSDEAPLIHPEMSSNLYSTHHFKHGDPDTAFDKTDDVIDFIIEYPRNSIPPIECFGCVAEYLPETGGYDVISNFPGPFGMQPVMAWALRVAGNKLRLRTPPNCGGNFGTKLCMFPHIVVMCVASKLAGRPVKWLEDRLENLAAANSAQNRITRVIAAHKNSGEVTALKMEHWDDNGAYLRAPMPGPIFRMHGTTTNGYKIQHLDVKMNIVATNKCPSGAVRGFGGPQLYFATERLMQKLSVKLELDPLEVIKKNLISADSFPYRTPAGALYDSGNFQRCLEEGVEKGNLLDLKRNQESARKAGKYYGIGYSTAVEPSQSNMGYITILKSESERKKAGPKDGAVSYVTVSVDSSGSVSVVSESVPQGQGHATVLAQIVSDQLGLKPEEIAVNLELDTAKDAWSIASGNYSSRFAPAIGSAAYAAAVRVREKLASIASSKLNVPISSIEFAEGKIYSKENPDNFTKFYRTAALAHWSPGSLPDGMEPGIRERVAWSAPELDSSNSLGEINSELAYGFAFDFCGVEIDPITYEIRVDRYISAHDCGTILNPAIVDGQVSGSFAAGLGAALYEEFVYDKDGAFFSGSFADYLVATAPEMPKLDIIHCTPSPSPYTLLGAKGIGEGNTYSTPVCIANALADALAVEDIVLPMSPSKVADILLEDEPPPPKQEMQSNLEPISGQSLTGQGSTSIEASPKKIWEFVLDPKKLANLIPGCNELKLVSENNYSAVVNLGVGPIRGIFDAKVSLTDLIEHSEMTLKGGLTGTLGSGSGVGFIKLENTPSGTILHYSYEVTVSGKVASIGGRMLRSAAKILIGQFFNNLGSNFREKNGINFWKWLKKIVSLKK